MPFCGRAGPRYRSHRNESDEERRNSTSSGFFLICFSFFFCFLPSPCHFRRRPKARNSLPGRFSVVFFSYFFFTKIGRCFFLSSSFFFLSNCLSYFWEMERNVGPLCWSFRTSRIGLRIFRFVFHSTVESSKTKLKTKIEKKNVGKWRRRWRGTASFQILRRDMEFQQNEQPIKLDVDDRWRRCVGREGHRQVRIGIPKWNLSKGPYEPVSDWLATHTAPYYFFYPRPSPTACRLG